MLVSKLAKLRADRGMTLPLGKLLALMSGAPEPTKLARKPKKHAGPAVAQSITLPGDHPDLLHWLPQVVSNHPNHAIDYNAAGAFADKLQEAGDWRHPLYRTLATPVMDSNRLLGAFAWARPDGLRSLNSHSKFNTGSIGFPGGHLGVSRSAHPNAAGGFDPVILVHHAQLAPVSPANPTGPWHFSVMHPHEYEAMRAEAATAGVELPSSEALGPVRHARTLTYVGGAPVPGGKRAIGIWDGGAEPSSVVAVDTVEAAEALASANAQHSALSFTPGPGNDSLHVFVHDGDATATRAKLAKHGVSYATLVPHGGSTLVHVVDQGGEFDGALPGKTVKGTATYTTLRPEKLGRATPTEDLHAG